MGSVGEEKGVLQLGGIGGLLAGTTLVLAFIVLFAFIPPVAGTDEFLASFPERRAVLTLFNSLILVASLLAITLFLALYRSLRKTSPAGALLGGIFGVLNSVLFAVSFAGAMNSSPFLAGLYADATVEEQTMIVIAQLTTARIYEGLEFLGILLQSLSFLALGVAMRGHPDFHKGFGWVSVVFGIVYVLFGPTAYPNVLPLAPALTEVASALLGSIIVAFYFLLGGKVYSLSRTPSAGSG